MYYVEMNVMLEMFFDNEKVFSVFEQILKAPSEEVLVPKILYESGISPADGAEILQSFVFLGILEETEKTLETGIFKFNPNSFVVLAICFFDDIVAKYCRMKANEMLDNGEVNFADLLDEVEDEEILKSVKGLQDFFKENGLL